MYIIVKEVEGKRGKSLKADVLTAEQVRTLKEVLVNEMNSLECLADKNPTNEDFYANRCRELDDIYDIL